MSPNLVSINPDDYPSIQRSFSEPLLDVNKIQPFIMGHEVDISG